MTKKLCPVCYTILEESKFAGKLFCNQCVLYYPQANAITEYTVRDIKMSKIFSDGDFNCRGSILPMDIIDLVRDIEKCGLQFPIAVQPANDVNHPLPEGFDFRIIAGHRRFEAFRLLKKEEIPVMIKVGLDEVQARLLNLGENLKRKALNLLQEAKAIKKLRDLGLNRRQVSVELGVSTSWVQVRFNLLDLPVEIQEEAAAGILNQYQVKQLFGLSTKEEQFDAIKKIKDARVRGERGISVGKSPLVDPNKKKRHAKNTVQEMIDHLGKSIGFGLHTRTLAWANGEISSAELFVSIKDYADAHNIDYEIPVRIEGE